MKRHTNGMRNRKAQTCTTIWRRQERTWKRDNLAGEFEEHEDEIRELIYDRNDSDPVKDLIRNSSVTNFFYSLGVEISGYLTGCSLRGESVAMACHKVRRALHLKKGQFDEKIEELVENATYGGELRIYFNAMFDRLISKDLRTISKASVSTGM